MKRGHGRGAVAVLQQHAARAGRAGLVIIVEFQQRQVLAGVALEELQVGRLEIAAGDLLRARRHVGGDVAAGQAQRQRVRAGDFLQRGEVFRVGRAVEKIDQPAAAKEEFGRGVAGLRQ